VVYLVEGKLVASTPFAAPRRRFAARAVAVGFAAGFAEFESRGLDIEVLDLAEGFLEVDLALVDPASAGLALGVLALDGLACVGGFHFDR
jgi:hypothetical protein